MKRGTFRRLKTATEKKNTLVKMPVETALTVRSDLYEQRQSSLPFKSLLKLRVRDLDLVISFWLRMENEENEEKNESDEMRLEMQFTLFPSDLVGLIHVMTVPVMIFRFDPYLRGTHTDPQKYQIDDDGLTALKLKHEWSNILCYPPLSKPGRYELTMYLKRLTQEEFEHRYPHAYKDSAIGRNFFYIGFLSDFPGGWIQDGCSLHQNNQVHPSHLVDYYSKEKKKNSIKQRTHYDIHESVYVRMAIDLKALPDPSIVTFDCLDEFTQHIWKPSQMPVYVGYCGYQKGVTVTLHPWQPEI